MKVMYSVLAVGRVESVEGRFWGAYKTDFLWLYTDYIGIRGNTKNVQTYPGLRLLWLKESSGGPSLF